MSQLSVWDLTRSGLLLVRTENFLSRRWPARASKEPWSTSTVLVERVTPVRNSPRRMNLPRILALSLASLCIATPFRALAFRTATEFPGFSSAAKVRWATDTLEYVLNRDLPTGMSVEACASTVRQAFATWMQPACTTVTFRDAGTTLAQAYPGDHLNTIQWVTRDWAGRGFPLDAAALTDVQYEQRGDGTWVVTEADLYLNADSVLWVDHPNASNQRDLLSVVTHEAGHMLGLLHPCEVGGADGAPDCATNPAYADTTMYPLYSPTQATLSADDVAGVCSLYPGARCESEGCSPGEQCTANGCRTACGPNLCAENEICSQGVCANAPPCTDPPCNEPSTCQEDADCSSPLRCSQGLCVPGAGATGDPCASGTDCAKGICSKNGACTATCSSSRDCGDGIQCTAGACVNDGKSVGTRCDSANDCAGGYCVAGLSKAPVCSRVCGKANAACPHGWSCDDLGGRQVCAPARDLESSCSLTVATSRPATAPLTAYAVALLLLRRRIYRRPKHNCVHRTPPQSESTWEFP
jgi:hypothetical protein